MRRSVAASFGQFVLVGGVGFVIDGSILVALVSGAGWLPWEGRAISFPVAVSVTWWLNRRLAFKGRGMSDRRTEYAAYVTVQLLGAAINLAVFGLCLRVLPWLAEWPLIPFAVGSAVALVFNYAGARFTIYRRPRAATSK
jgi:putative flippase GtrA